MKREAPRHVAIWIDSHQATLLALEAEAVEALQESGEGWSHDHVDAQRYLLKRQYYSAVLCHLGPQDEILILGPGQAKRELCRLIERQEGIRGRVIGLYDASRLAESELVVPTGAVWRTAKEDRGRPAVLFQPASRLPEGVGRST